MPESWSSEEIATTVADYFDMLDKEIRGVHYNKSEHRRTLVSALNNRSEGAVERKHQNISAILIECGFVYIAGYKPLSNYQVALRDAVARRLERSTELELIVRAHVSAEADIPAVDDILSVLTNPPKPQNASSPTIAEGRPPTTRHVDYLGIEARNSSLGRAGEEFALRYEIARLLANGRDSLAARVEHVAATLGDGLGYDVLSFNEDGSERLIEVKTTAYGASTPFFVTPRELSVSASRLHSYHLYRPYNFRRDPRMYVRSGRIADCYRLEPSQYRAYVG